MFCGVCMGSLCVGCVCGMSGMGVWYCGVVWDSGDRIRIRIRVRIRIRIRIRIVFVDPISVHCESNPPTLASCGFLFTNFSKGTGVASLCRAELRKLQETPP